MLVSLYKWNNRYKIEEVKKEAPASLMRRRGVLGFGALMALGGLTGCAGNAVSIYSIKERHVRSAPLIDPEQRVRQSIVLTAMSALETPYQWGGDDFDEGFDCSGLIYYAYTQNGIDPEKMPRSTGQMVKASVPIARAHLRAGDPIFFNTLGSRYSHVGLYLGKGNFLNAPSKGKAVRVDALSNTYWSRNFTGARRFTLLDELVKKVAGLSQGSHDNG